MHPHLTPLRILVFFSGLALSALFVVPGLRVSLAPSGQNRELQIQVGAMRASPFDMERRIVSRLENALSGLSGLKHIRSESRQGYGSITLEFSKGEDMAAKRLEVSAILRRVFPSLPPGTYYPQIIGGDANRQTEASPSLLYHIEGRGSAEVVRQKGEALLRKTLLDIESIADIRCFGGQQEVFIVEIDPQRAATYGISRDAVAYALQQLFSDDFPGAVEDAPGLSLHVRAVPTRIDETLIAGIILSMRQGRPLRIGDVAQVRVEALQPESYFRINGKEAAGAYIALQASCNKVREARRIRTRIEEALLHEPDLRFHLAQDRTEFVQEELRKAWMRAGASLGILLLLLLLSYRNGRMPFILTYSLAVNLGLTILLSYLLRIEWHTYTLAGISVAFGLMIDNAIVMLDAYRRQRSRRIFTALLAATLTSMAALSLVFLLPEDQQRTLRDFALVILVSLFSSLATVLFLAPACYELWAGSNPPIVQATGSAMFKRRRLWKRLQRYEAYIRFLARRRAWLAAFCILAFGLPVFLLPHEVSSDRWYASAWNARIVKQEIRPALEKWLGGALGFFVRHYREDLYYRHVEATALHIQAALPHGHTAAHMNDLLLRFERLLYGIPGIRLFTTQIYDGQSGNIEVLFEKNAEKSMLPLQVKNKVQDLAQSFSGVQWNIYGKGEAFANHLYGLDFSGRTLSLKGYDYSGLERQAEKTAALLRQDMRVQRINTDQKFNSGDQPLPEWRLRLDGRKLAGRGIYPGMLLAALEAQASPLPVFLQSETGMQTGLVQMKNAHLMDAYRLLKQPVSLPGRRQLYPEQVSALELTQTSGAIYRENRQYVRTVGYDYVGSYEQAAALHETVLKKVRQELPIGYSIEDAAGQAWSDPKKPLHLLLVLLGLNFFLCAILFESLKQPFLIMLTAPLSFIGILLVFPMFHFPFDQGGFAAFVMLGGIAVNASIFIINDLNQARGKARNFPAVLVKVLYRRSGAIWLTVLSSICGFLPFLYEGPETPFWFALAAGAIGGLLMSLLVLFLIFPVFIWKK